MRRSAIPAGEYVPTADGRAFMRLTWRQFEAWLKLRGDEPVPRAAFLDGVLELMTPSADHERIKSYIGCLVEAYAWENDIDLSPCGSPTLRSKLKKAGIEPDECYNLVTGETRPVPDLAIEVVWTSGGLGKLEIYARLGIGEVWQWRAGRIDVFLLRGGEYEQAPRSALLPDLDLELLGRFLDGPSALQNKRAFLKEHARRSRRR